MERLGQTAERGGIDGLATRESVQREIERRVRAPLERGAKKIRVE